MPIEFVKAVNVGYCSVEVEYLDKLYAKIAVLVEALEWVDSALATSEADLFLDGIRYQIKQALAKAEGDA
jgi:hypothetical protein